MTLTNFTRKITSLRALLKLFLLLGIESTPPRQLSHWFYFANTALRNHTYFAITVLDIDGCVLDHTTVANRCMLNTCNVV